MTSLSNVKKPKKASDLLEDVYEQVKKLLEGYAPPFKLRDLGVRNKKSAQLVVPKPVVISGAYGGKPVDLQMAAVILQKGYVGFYVTTIYMNETAKKRFPRLVKLLKGKTCFRLKKLDGGLTQDIESALELGAKTYRERGWL
jgi:hypothetical protein